MAISVVVADDHVAVRRGLRPCSSRSATSRFSPKRHDGPEAIGAVERCRPDVLILDLIMPTLRGVDVLRELATRKLPTRVVVLSMHAGEAHVADVFRSGATGYVLRNASASEVVHAVREAAAGRRFLSEPLSDATVDQYLARSAPEADP